MTEPDTDPTEDILSRIIDPTDEKLSRILTATFQRIGLPEVRERVEWVVVEGDAAHIHCEGWDYVLRARLPADTLDRLAVMEEHELGHVDLALLPWNDEEAP